jgi:hypothetical protein
LGDPAFEQLSLGALRFEQFGSFVRDASGGFGDEEAIGGRFEVDSAGLVLDNDLLEVCRWV